MGIWGWSQRARKHYPREYNLFVTSMASEGSLVLKKKLKLQLVEVLEMGSTKFSECLTLACHLK